MMDTEQGQQPQTKKTKLTASNDHAIESESFSFHPIAYIRTCFRERNGTPRQGNVSKVSRGKIDLKTLCHYSDPKLFIDGLKEYSHVCLIFVFHMNTNHAIKSKVAPPRLNGKKVGVLATRRPNPIGLSVAKIEKIDGQVIFLSGVDLLDGTPILDIKPYVPLYDSFPQASYPQWIENPVIKTLDVEWKPEATQQLEAMVKSKKLEFFDTVEDITEAIKEVASQDPRSLFYRDSYSDAGFAFCIDVLNVCFEFVEPSDPSQKGKAVVAKIEDWSKNWKQKKQQTKEAWAQIKSARASDSTTSEAQDNNNNTTNQSDS